jgi:hypothetical protein
MGETGAPFNIEINRFTRKSPIIGYNSTLRTGDCNHSGSSASNKWRERTYSSGTPVLNLRQIKIGGEPYLWYPHFARHRTYPLFTTKIFPKENVSKWLM